MAVVASEMRRADPDGRRAGRVWRRASTGRPGQSARGACEAWTPFGAEVFFAAEHPSRSGRPLSTITKDGDLMHGLGQTRWHVNASMPMDVNFAYWCCDRTRSTSAAAMTETARRAWLDTVVRHTPTLNPERLSCFTAEASLQEACATLWTSFAREWNSSKRTWERLLTEAVVGARLGQVLSGAGTRLRLVFVVVVDDADFPRSYGGLCVLGPSCLDAERLRRCIETLTDAAG